MNPIRLNRISVKLGATLIVLFIVLVFCIESVLYMLFIRFYSDDVLSKQIGRNDSYASVLSDHFDGTTIAHVLRIENGTDNLLLIMDQDNQILGSTKGVNLLSSAYIETIIQHGMDKPIHGPVINSDWKNEPYFVTESAITFEGKNAGRIIMFNPTEPMKKAIKALRSAFSGVAAIGLAFSALLILFVSGKIVQPLLRMIRITQRISEGKHDWELEARGSDEIAQLSLAINRMSANLQHYEQQRKQFLADISHELRTPLTYMKGYSEVLQSGMVTNEEDRQRYLQLLHTQSIHIQRLVQDLFELANLEHGSFQLSIGRVSLDKVMQTSLELGSKAIQLSGIEVVYSPSSLPLHVKGDERRIQQVVINLLDNAKKFTSSGGTITVATSRDNDLYALIEISDSGIGIPEKDLPHIWDRLYRVDKSRSRATGGTGLGLAICKEIVALHHGNIEAESTEGSGTTFRVRLPLYLEDTSRGDSLDLEKEEG